MADLLESMSVHEIDSFIADCQQILAILPLSDPRRIPYLLFLASRKLLRHTQSNQKEDLDKSIFHSIELIFVPHLWLEYKSLIFPAVLILANALLARSIVSNQPEDAIFATKYLRHLRDQPHATLGFPRHAVTTLFLSALAFLVKLEDSNVVQNIEEMTVLFHELLTENASEGDVTLFSTLLAEFFFSYSHLWTLDQPLTQVIECLRLAKMLKPELRRIHLNLAFCLCARYLMTLVNDDYEEAASIVDELIASSSPGDIQDELVAKVREFVATLAVLRPMLHPTPEYSEEAMYRARATVSSNPVGHHFRPWLNDCWESIAEDRFGYFGPIEGYEASPMILQPLPVAYYESEHGAELCRIFDDIDLLGELLSGIRNNDITNIDEALELGRTKLTSSFPIHLLMSKLFESFGDMLFEAFRRTKNIEYLNESISTRRQILGRPSPQFLRFGSIRKLSATLLARFLYFPSYCTQDLDEATELLSQCANDRHANLPSRFFFACSWSSISRLTRHPSISTAYETAVSLMQYTPLFAPTLQLQHATLANTDTDYHRLPLDYASYQVDLRQLEEAIVTLERGRALLWSEMRHLRTSIDQLQQAHPQLAHKFAAVNRDLEELTKSIPPSHKLSVDDGATDDARAVDPFGRFLLKQRSLLKERDNLITQIQALPGFQSFLTSPSFDTLRSAASSGPVVIINHSKWRSDILILFHDASPSLISTPHDFYDRATTLKDKLLNSRNKYGLDSPHYDETLAFVLAELYKLVGKSVIDRFHQLDVPEQSRIWWCPTSVFCSFPLHAMGPIPSDDGEMRYFLDLYICSYTPTLSALIQSRDRDSGSRSLDRPSLLLVAQPDPTIPTVGSEIKVVRSLDTEVTSLLSEAATPATVIDGFRNHRFVHFACHGTLEAGKPFEAGFELYGGDRLTLLEIVRSDLPTAEFAFLSACHTAEVTEGSIVDEGLHLAAAVQYCGFRSVVGTMWAMADVDGRDLAKQFYKALFSTSEGEQGIPYYERSAKSLRFAVKKLRRKKPMTLERWVNFVHYGA
ncbi:CHAT domain-containing protein [Lactarius akahatsu]|uniref:CHAT domain-containing protein n=1 Tax=Lactarius akahatsu TaxID=416441 RepID=A0AAD4Q4T3_9AGAM|nr:CHAT domain-containing protein [Lactarius akahatsu]